MLKNALTRPDGKDMGQPGVPPPGRHCPESQPPTSLQASFLLLAHRPPSSPTPTTPPTPTHSYTDMVSRMMVSDLHVLSLRKYSSSNQGLKINKGNQE